MEKININFQKKDNENNPPIIVMLRDRMGNQMFQYALYLSLLKKGKNVFIDDESKYLKPEENVLVKTFNLKYKRMTEDKYKETDTYANLLPNQRHYREKNGDFDEKIYNLNAGILEGYWQTEKYFEDGEIQKQLRKDFTCPESVETNPAFIEYKQKIKKTTSVSLHIRRTDYTAKENKALYWGICNDFYYENAMNFVKEKFPNAIFYIFSDDKEWAKEHYNCKDSVVIDDQRLSDIDEFFLMKECDHHILANSSFSWWATWLDDDPDAMIIAPGIWNTRDKKGDVYNERMTVVPSGCGTMAVVCNCTKRNSDWDKFYRTCEENFVKGTDKEYFIIAAFQKIPAQETEKIHILSSKWTLVNKIFGKKTVLRLLEKYLVEFNHIYYLNAKEPLKSPVTIDEVLKNGGVITESQDIDAPEAATLTCRGVYPGTSLCYS